MPVLDARTPARAPGVELLGELSGSGYASAPGLVRRSDGQTVQLTPLLYALLDLVDGHRDPGELARQLSERCGKQVAAEDVDHLLEQKLAPLGLLLRADGSAPAVQKATPLLGLKLKVVVSDPAVTRRLTAPFAWLFRSWVVVPVLLAFAVTCWWVLWEQGLASATRQAFDSPGLLLAVFGLTVLSAGWHEFGHAAACRARGATPGAMGAGLYLVWPAFYTDVDDSYRLSRRGRLVVDLGGLYFNVLLAVAVTAAWLVVRADALLLVVAAQLLLMVRQLAPVIRADGYHILADLIGVPDLFSQMRPTLRGMLPQHWGEPQPLQPWARWVVRGWVLIVVPVLLWLLVLGVLLLPRLVATAWAGLRDEAGQLTRAAESGDVLGLVAGVLSMVALVLPVAAMGYLLVRLAHRAGTAVWSRTHDRPVARAGAVVAAGALLAAVAWAWWPSGQYVPVQPGERGTIADATQLQSVRASAYRPLDGVAPQTTYALVPRDPDAPTFLLVRGDDGSLRSVLTDGSRTGVAFPFALPDAPGPGDNQALAVNTGDGTVVYDVAVAQVWLRDGQVADNRNEAYALTSCAQCTTVAVAFQVVFVVGQSDAVAPVNAAVAANGGCVECLTTALAVQLVVTLEREPDRGVRESIDAALARLDDLQGSTDPAAAVEAVQQELLALLTARGLLEESTLTQDSAAEPTPASASPSPSASASPTATASSSRSPSPSPTTSRSPSPSPTASSSPSPSASAEPTSSPEASAGSTPTAEPTASATG